MQSLASLIISLRFVRRLRVIISDLIDGIVCFLNNMYVGMAVVPGFYLGDLTHYLLADSTLVLLILTFVIVFHGPLATT